MPGSSLAFSKGAATGVNVTDGLTASTPVLACFGRVPGDGGRGDHRGAHDMGAGLAPLAALEIAVGGRRGTFAGRDQLAVGAVAHRAAGIAPFKARVLEDRI